jgi:hypothetical protein
VTGREVAFVLLMSLVFFGLVWLWLVEPARPADDANGNQTTVQIRP